MNDEYARDGDDLWSTTVGDDWTDVYMCPYCGWGHSHPRGLDKCECCGAPLMYPGRDKL